MREEKDYTYRSMQEERKYGLYWYSGLWTVLRPILIALTVGVLVIGIVSTVGNRLYDEFAAPVDPQDPTEYGFEIVSGESLNRVAGNLEKAGLIRNKTVFKYYCDFAGMGQKIQVGSYQLTKGMTLSEIADRLTTGDGNPLVRNITLIPGESIEEFAAKGSKIAISDAGCGAILCKAAMQAASLNVFINTKSMKDRTCAEALEEEANALLAKYTILGDAVFNKVSDRIRG